jgi:hypothetical protein
MAGKNLQKKKNHNHLISNNHDVCTAAALCISNILDVMVLKNIYYLQILNYEMVGKNTSVQLMYYDITM